MPNGKYRPKIRPERRALMRLAVYERDGYACRSCGWSVDVPEGYDGTGALGRGKSLELDHIFPYALGGKFELDNLQALCSTCNGRKGAKI